MRLHAGYVQRVSLIKCAAAAVDARYVTIIGSPPQQETVPPAATTIPRPRDAAADVAARPQRSAELAYLTLARLRTYRESLLAEEVRVSYWRRILQARRDLLRAGSPLGDHGAIAAVLTEDSRRNTHRMILTLHPQRGMPLLPTLPELWELLIDVEDDAASTELFSRLGEAESILSSYRQALHRRLNRATADLVARYHDEPRLCLVALPSPPSPAAA